MLDGFGRLSLDKMESVKLMNRVDTKYVVAAETAMRILRELPEDYMVLEIAPQLFGQYRTMYYDTADLKMFHAHVTTRYPRFKVRTRSYLHNGMHYLEVKHKKMNGRTSKKRLPTDDENDLDGRFVARHTPFIAEELHPKLETRYNRIILVNRNRMERVTLDFDLQFHSHDGTATPVFNNAAIVELKQERRAQSVITRMLRDENIRPYGMSKYCVGMLLLDNNLNHKMYKTKFVKFIKTAQWIS